MDGWFRWLHCKPAHSRRRLLPPGEKTATAPATTAMVAKVDFSRNISVLGMVKVLQSATIFYRAYELRISFIGGCGVDPCRRFINQADCVRSGTERISV